MNLICLRLNPVGFFFSFFPEVLLPSFFQGTGWSQKIKDQLKLKVDLKFLQFYTKFD